MFTALDKAVFIMGLREVKGLCKGTNIFEGNKIYRAIEIGEAFYMGLAELGYDSVKEASLAAHISSVPDIPTAQRESILTLTRILNNHKSLNAGIANRIINDLHLITINGFTSPLNFLCKVRYVSSTIPKTGQGAGLSSMN